MRSSLGRNRRRTELRRERHRRQSRLAVPLVPKLINDKKLEREVPEKIGHITVWQMHGVTAQNHVLYSDRARSLHQ